jgi:hypothetical protein
VNTQVPIRGLKGVDWQPIGVPKEGIATAQGVLVRVRRGIFWLRREDSDSGPSRSVGATDSSPLRDGFLHPK